jgi:hypothetical protein
VVPDTDYSIESVGAPGGVPTTGGAVTGSFDVINYGPTGDPGVGFAWSVYASWITTSGDAFSALVDWSDGSNEPGLDFNDTVTINYSGTWPSTGGDYTLIVNVDALWDGDLGNNTNMATTVSIDDIAFDAEVNDSAGPFAGTVDFFTDLNPSLPTLELRPDERIRIDGLLEANGAYDTYGFTAGPGTISVGLDLVWDIAKGDAASLFLWPESGPGVEEVTVTVGLERMTVIGLTEGSNYYVGVLCLPSKMGTSYSLTITGGTDF